MSKKSPKLFYVRIDFVDLLDFATDPIGKKMSLLGFAKELMKEKSEIPQIQRIINEAHCYVAQKKEAGRESARKRQEGKERQKLESTTFNGPSTTLNDVGTTFNGPSTDPQPITVTVTDYPIPEKKGGILEKEQMGYGFALGGENKVNSFEREENPFGYTEEPIDD